MKPDLKKRSKKPDIKWTDREYTVKHASTGFKQWCEDIDNRMRENIVNLIIEIVKGKQEKDK